MQLRKIEIEDYIFANDVLRFFERSFQNNVKGHVFLKSEKKPVKYVFSNTGFVWYSLGFSREEASIDIGMVESFECSMQWHAVSVTWCMIKTGWINSLNKYASEICFILWKFITSNVLNLRAFELKFGTLVTHALGNDHTEFWLYASCFSSCEPVRDRRTDREDVQCGLCDGRMTMLSGAFLKPTV